MTMKSPLLRVAALIVPLFLVAGCETTATTAPAVQVQRSVATINAPKDRVWPHLISEIGLNYPVQAIEKDSGLVTTSWVTMPAGFNNMNAGRWVIPPGGFLATWDGLRMNMKVLVVEPEAGRTQISINCHFEAFESNVTKSWIVARSNGAIENGILTRVEEAVARAPATASTPVQPAQAKESSPADALLALKKLHDAGAITDEEYAAKKKALLEKL